MKINFFIAWVILKLYQVAPAPKGGYKLRREISAGLGSTHHTISLVYFLLCALASLRDFSKDAAGIFFYFALRRKAAKEKVTAKEYCVRQQ